MEIANKFVHGYWRESIHTLEEVLPYIGEGRVFGGDMISLRGLRYQVFQKSLTCSRCNIVGVFFAKEKSAIKTAIQIEGTGRHRYEWQIMPNVQHHSNEWHLNLYAVRADGTEVLMTRDHIMPRAKGGPNTLENQETMCERCNGKKGSKLPKLPVPVPVSVE